MDGAKSTAGAFDFDPKHENPTGLNWFITGLFLLGDLAGGGIVALPAAVMQSDFYPGIAITIVMCILTTYTAYILGLSWVILQKYWPQYRQHCRKPYPEIGARALGPWAKSAASVCIDVTQFGVTVVFLLLSAKNIHDFVQVFAEKDFSFCYVILIVGVCLLPVTFLKSPQDFWWAAVVAIGTTSCAVVLVVIGAAIDMDTCFAHRTTNHKRVATNYLLSFGTILFAFNGHSCFPTIFHDMKKPYHFTRSAVMAFIVLGVMYMLVSVMGFVAYGNSMRESIINSIQITALQQAVNILITLHCLLTLTIVLNPLNQEAEEIFRIPQGWCWQRVVVRSSMLVAAVFVAESLPTFGPLLDIVGSTTTPLTSLVFPCLFYLYLAVGDERNVEKGGNIVENPPTWREVLAKSPKLRLALCAVIVVIGVLGGTASAYSAIRELATTQFAMPCYVRPFVTSNEEDNSRHTNCCGRYQNISRSGDVSVCSPFKDFYNQY